MKIILASGNKGKVKEFKSWMDGFEVLAFSEVMEPFEIIEDGNSFKENALIKARAVYEKLEDKSAIVISDDSGISVNALNHEPGIYSARYAGVDATATQNLDKLIQTLKEKGLKKTPAYYTAAIAIVCEAGEFCVHGWMHGDAIDEKRGNNGFGYDPMFIPDGFDLSLGELDESVKKELSHRSRALELAQILIKTLTK
ncbi:RdgB/HAM1 family non-canonical purine NTP pyrophosphatase [Sulfurospirillum arcachonense]|uniref:RdgB/HAM1 family non-canonical purine NTP pyrophosphatase n=1 Tax=Sulfurospirillum arcachonense TaxID=57666 RepID=UPI00046AC05E|nr:RdgB/HAM1 family non-canonical purine NTP pyrophosphatase [Sulfurospirillum arcachonense]